MQRRIEQTDSYRQTVHGAEEPNKVRTLHGKQLLERGAAILFVIRQNHGPHVRNAILGEEHVLGAA